MLELAEMMLQWDVVLAKVHLSSSGTIWGISNSSRPWSSLSIPLQFVSMILKLDWSVLVKLTFIVLQTRLGQQASPYLWVHFPIRSAWVFSSVVWWWWLHSRIKISVKRGSCLHNFLPLTELSHMQWLWELGRLPESHPMISWALVFSHFFSDSLTHFWHELPWSSLNFIWIHPSNSKSLISEETHTFLWK